MITTQLIEKLKTALNGENARGSVTVEEGSPRSQITITPKLGTAAAMIWVFHEDAGQWTATIGRGVVAEVSQAGGRYSDGDREADIVATVDAVINRGCEETTWEYKGEVIRSKGVIQLGGRRVAVRWAELRPIALLLSTRRRTYYTPY
jgi:hypothetical protein